MAKLDTTFDIPHKPISRIQLSDVVDRLLWSNDFRSLTIIKCINIH